MACFGCLWKSLAWTLLLVPVTYIVVKTWMAQKSYVFNANTLAEVTKIALTNSEGEEKSRNCYFLDLVLA